MPILKIEKSALKSHFQSKKILNEHFLERQIYSPMGIDSFRFFGHIFTRVLITVLSKKK